MATSNREFDNAIVVQGVEKLKAENRLVSETLVGVDLRYDSPADVNGPGYVQVLVSTAYVILQEDADALLKNAFK